MSMVLEVVHKWTAQSTGCGARGAWASCQMSTKGDMLGASQSDGPRLVTEGLTPSDSTGKELPPW